LIGPRKPFFLSHEAIGFDVVVFQKLLQKLFVGLASVVDAGSHPKVVEVEEGRFHLSLFLSVVVIDGHGELGFVGER
jgi:hypothetical protein